MAPNRNSKWGFFFCVNPLWRTEPDNWTHEESGLYLFLGSDREAGDLCDIFNVYLLFPNEATRTDRMKGSSLLMDLNDKFCHRSCNLF